LNQILECLCGKDIVLIGSEIINDEVIYAGNSNKLIGKSFSIDVVCNKCKRQLIIELSITDKNWGMKEIN